MKSIKHIHLIILSIFFIAYLAFCQIYYSTSYLGQKEASIINEQYSLNLPDIEWKYTQYERNSILKEESQIVLKNYYECNLINNCKMETTISITPNKQFMNLTLPFIKDSFEIMIEDDIVWNETKMNIKLLKLHSGEVLGLKEDEYIPIYRITLKKNNILYQFQFDLNDCTEDIYNKNETQIHTNNLEIFLNFVEDVLLN